MKVVVDTNILVSSFLSPQGSPSEIIRMIMSGHLRICYDMRILNEYKGVLERPKFRISPSLSAKTLEQIHALGESTIASRWVLQLPDPRDVAFLEVALAAQADCLITGNLKHFPISSRQGMRVFSPAEFLEFYRNQQDRAGGMVKSPSVEYRTRKRKGSLRSGRGDQEQREMSLTEFFRRMDATRDPDEKQWTAEEVSQVIHRMR